MNGTLMTLMVMIAADFFFIEIKRESAEISFISVISVLFPS